MKIAELKDRVVLGAARAYARRTIPADSGKLVIYTGPSGEGAAVPTGDQLLAAVAAAERREALLEGRDEIATTLLRDADIRAFQDRDRSARPWIHQTKPRDTRAV